MRDVTRLLLNRFIFLIAVSVIAAAATWPMISGAQDRTPESGVNGHRGESSDSGDDLHEVISTLLQKVAALEAVLESRYPAVDTMVESREIPIIDSRSMGMMDTGDEEMREMMSMMRTMMQMKMMEMKGNGQTMAREEMAGRSMMMDSDERGTAMTDGRMRMEDMMGKMGASSMSTAVMKMTAALPGFPGASRIYHIGATGFFLDHPEHIRLSSEQQAALNGIKEKTLLQQTTMQRQIDEAEQELWTLTASDAPVAEKIDAKVRAIETLRGDQRIAFIHAVGEAASVLTHEQRQVLVFGSSPPDNGTSADSKN